MDRKHIYMLNPWWRGKEAILSDKHILEYESSSLKFYPEGILSEIDLSNGGIYNLRGPRQVGKTTLLKLLIRELLLKKNIKPIRLLYLSCDMIKSSEELADILTFYKKSFDFENENSFIFLDETTAVPGWQTAIKFLVDSGTISGDLIIITGSSAYDLRISSERLPGRRGKGIDLVYLPLSFKEFAALFGYSCPNLTIEDIQRLSFNDLKELEFKCAFMEDLFEIYSETGGFPKVINEHYKRGNISEETLRIYTDFVLSDAEKYLRSRKFVMELFLILSDITGQRVSWNSISRKFSTLIKSHDTIQKYFEFLSYSFIVSIQYFVDISKKVIRPKKMKKIYPIDPVIAKVAETFSGKLIEMGHKIEMIVIRHLLKKREVSMFGLDLVKGPYFWYSDKGKEIDFVVESKNALIPLEVKYQNTISPGDYTGMKRVFGGGIVVTKNTIFRDGNIIGIPAWLFVSLIE